LIIVDDNSSDNTEEVVRLFEASNILYIKNVDNIGACASRNIGIKRAKYELITFLDSDDVWIETYLEEQIKYYNSYTSKIPDFGLQFCGYSFITDENMITHMPKAKFDLSSKFSALNSLFDENFISTQTILSTKEVLVEVHGFDENLPAFQDWDLAIRIATKYSIFYLQKSLVNVYLSNDSISRNHHKRFSALNYLVSKYRTTNIFSDKLINKLCLKTVYYKLYYNVEDDLSFNIFSILSNAPLSFMSYYTVVKFYLKKLKFL
jgi:glycosyltransferase involved in cell wall biosynthesis